MGYRQTDGESIKEIYFVLVDETRHLMVVEASTKNDDDRQTGEVDLTGKIHSTPSDLRQVLESDIPIYEEEVFITVTKFFLVVPID